jgi:hypothetical protein
MRAALADNGRAREPLQMVGRLPNQWQTQPGLAMGGRRVLNGYGTHKHDGEEMSSMRWHGACRVGLGIGKVYARLMPKS